MTEQASLDALLADEIPEGLREALTLPTTDCYCGHMPSAHGKFGDLPCMVTNCRCTSYDPSERVPLPLATPLTPIWSGPEVTP